MIVNLLALIFLSNFYILQISTESLHDLPWTVDRGNWIITAKLISSNNEVYDIREYVHSSEVVRGKITISSGDDTMDIFYSSEFENDRLVIQNQQCSKFTFKKKWDNILLNIDSKNPLLNHVLLTGPSILFRINGKSFIWEKDESTILRGFPVHSAKTTFNKNLDITYYYKTYLDSPDILQASRLQLSGLDSSFGLIANREKFYLDIYSLEESEEEFGKTVTVTPGIGCPLNLITSESHDWLMIPEMSKSNYHFIARTTVDGPKKSSFLSEMFVNSKDLTTSLKTIEQGILTESLYDYNLGTVYVSLKKGRCSVSSIGPNSPGISKYGTFTSYGFLNYRDTFKYSYLGKYFIRPGYETYVWERVDYNYAFEGEKYDKFVTSHYFVSSADAKLFKDFILVRTTTNNYKKVNNDTFELIETKTKDYYGLEEVESGRNYETELSLRFSDCYQDSTGRKTLAIYFSCKDNQYIELNCVKYAEKHYNKFLENLKDILVRQNISPARIANIDLVFEGQNIKALVTFLKIPNIEDSIQKERMRLSQEALLNLDRITAESVRDCLLKQGEFYYDQEAIVFCNADYTRPSICGRIQSAEKIVKMDAGTICDVYYPINSYSQFRKEIHLDKMEDYIRRLSLAIYMTDDGLSITNQQKSSM
ncbi:uncharacterized protein LOC128390319 isoform X2 [Panonychus citri]|uniref:uncharacterized protein LOC128390319 isoform X2 n=1 Tax=Panonychus citri TaxID=50023 RepID=UPI002307C0C7|nr:uncharacterized protein LOC128390319 isoform X2 [Panonychus citri]